MARLGSVEEGALHTRRRCERVRATDPLATGGECGAPTCRRYRVRRGAPSPNGRARPGAEAACGIGSAMRRRTSHRCCSWGRPPTSPERRRRQRARADVLLVERGVAPVSPPAHVGGERRAPWSWSFRSRQVRRRAPGRPSGRSGTARRRGARSARGPCGAACGAPSR